MADGCKPLFVSTLIFREAELIHELWIFTVQPIKRTALLHSQRVELTLHWYLAAPLHFAVVYHR